MSAGAQTIRDVLIRIGLQTNSSSFSAPDLRKVEREANDATAAVEKLNTALKSGGSARAAGGTSSQRAPDMFAGMDLGTNRYKDQITRQGRFNQQILQSDELVLKRSETIAKSADAAERANRKLIDSERAALEISNQRAEATMILANAGMKLARGVAFVTAANEAEYQSMLKTIAQAQGYFDIFTGIIDGYKAYIAFSKVATAAKLIEARATDTQTAAEIRLAVAKQASSGIGRGGAALAIGAVAAYGAYKFGEGMYNESGLGTLRQSDASRRSRALSYGSEEAMADRNARGSEAISRLMDMLEGRVSSGRNIRAAMTSGPRAAIGYDQALAGLARDQRASSEILRSGPLVGSPQQTNSEIAQRELKVQEMALQFEQEKQGIYQKQQEALQRQLDTSLSLKQAAVETLRAEENRYRSLEASLGRMSAGEASRLKTIGEKVQAGGKLSRSEAEFLERSGIGGAQAESYFVQEGRKRGAGGILAAFSENRGLQAAQTNLQDFSTGEAARAATQAREMLEKVEKSIAKSFEAEAQLFGRILNYAEASAAEQAKLEQRVSKIENGPLGNPFK